MRNRFDRQLEELNEMLIHMGELCETAIEEATGALEGHDIARAKAVITADSEIDQMEKKLKSLPEAFASATAGSAGSAKDLGIT